MLQFGRAIGKRPQLQFQGGIVRALWLYPWRFQGAKYSIDSDSSSDEEESVRQEARGSAKYLGRVYPRGPANDAYDNEIMSLALELARECFEKDEVPIGAIILNHKGKVRFNMLHRDVKTQSMLPDKAGHWCCEEPPTRSS
eukprot:gb/GECG01010743.1/.p1 GENE.gb/GECG01010743.1/~~gb/GECG01010743.1/.p1  ORF type:complete len:141 (+),score=15.86 gb/GECG01010743.1/:1-423(+)